MKTNKYLSVYQELSDQIKKGEIPPKKTLPSENDLAERFQTSRETVRKALNLLSQNGFIQKVKGKGSIVLDAEKLNFPVSGLTSFKELADRMKSSSKTIVYEFGLMQPDAFLQKQLRADSTDEIWKVVRAREIEGERIILDKDFLNKKYVPFLSKGICENSIFEYIENDLQLKISYAKKEIVVEDCTEEDYQYLDIAHFQHIVVVRNYIFLDDTSLFQYTESRHRLDKFRFVDFARRGQA
ncbi:trehalose operon repressor [Metabacillus sp. RGM 3146]|uniref:trehalose operon repressor n=1 Tax=Metabacillus sp. RGM 3146 TaxID=3401092 RepID=UPI003B9A1585